MQGSAVVMVGSLGTGSIKVQLTLSDKTQWQYLGSLAGPIESNSFTFDATSVYIPGVGPVEGICEANIGIGHGISPTMQILEFAFRDKTGQVMVSVHLDNPKINGPIDGKSIGKWRKVDAFH